jgi:hypothetical protein
MTGTLERPEHALAFELRARWADQRPVVLTLTERCIVRRIEGRVERVAVTGAFVVIEGWHVPLGEILAVHSPHHSQKEAA